MFPRALHYVEGFPLGLEVVEELGVSEEEGEELVNVDGKVLADNLPGLLALPPHLVGEDVRGDYCWAGQGSGRRTGISRF